MEVISTISEAARRWNAYWTSTRISASLNPHYCKLPPPIEQAPRKNGTIPAAEWAALNDGGAAPVAEGRPGGEGEDDAQLSSVAGEDDARLFSSVGADNARPSPAIPPQRRGEDSWAGAQKWILWRCPLPFSQ
jgi:hypothetical protein